MLTITFAFVVATALFFVFERTRGMGVIGVFVLLTRCFSPGCSCLLGVWSFISST